MSKLNARLIVSDFDGTLINSMGEIPSHVKDAIDRYTADGGIFAVCTGRILASILPRVRALGLKGLVAACQSTVIADIATGELLRCGGLTPQQASEICAVMEREGQSVNIYSGDKYYTDIPSDNPARELHEKTIKVAAINPGIPLSQFVLSSGIVCQKVASLCFPKDRDRLYKLLIQDFGDKYDVACSANVLVEVAPLGDTKGAAIDFLANYYGIDLPHIVAVGDNLNDVSMIQRAGTGVAVANAESALKLAADYVCPLTNDEGAIAHVIEKFGYIHE